MNCSLWNALVTGGALLALLCTRLTVTRHVGWFVFCLLDPYYFERLLLIAMSFFQQSRCACWFFSLKSPPRLKKYYLLGSFRVRGGDILDFGLVAQFTGIAIARLSVFSD
jgi:hypothetical protein